MLRMILAIMILSVTSVIVNAQKSVDGEKKVYPSVFQIGDQPDAFEALGEEYETPLLEVCDSDVKKAHTQWSIMLKAMEKFAKQKEFDLDGVKMWLKVFWKKDGTIDYIAFHLKPTSKNVDVKALERFLKSFVKYYKSQISADENFSQYSSASFPTLPQLVPDKK